MILTQAAFFIYKINGSATFRTPSGQPWTNSTNWQLETIEDVLTAFAQSELNSDQGARNHVSFSWDVQDQNNKIRSKVLTALQQTRTLVVIGYSFPFFNRAVDKQTLAAMSNLKHIVLQEPDNETASSILERIAQRLSDRAQVRPTVFGFADGRENITHKTYPYRTDFYIPSSFG